VWAPVMHRASGLHVPGGRISGVYYVIRANARGYRCRRPNTSCSRHMHICVSQGRYTFSVFSITEEVSCIVVTYRSYPEERRFGKDVGFN
jgi:hypothetical protein